MLPSLYHDTFDGCSHVVFRVAMHLEHIDVLHGEVWRMRPTRDDCTIVMSDSPRCKCACIWGCDFIFNSTFVIFGAVLSFGVRLPLRPRLMEYFALYCIGQVGEI